MVSILVSLGAASCVLHPPTSAAQDQLCCWVPSECSLVPVGSTSPVVQQHCPSPGVLALLEASGACFS